MKTNSIPKDSQLNSEKNRSQLLNSNRRFPKTDSRYWAQRIYKPVNAKLEESPNWMMRLQFKGERFACGLRSSNKEVASRLARNIYNDLVQLGVEATYAKYRSKGKKEEQRTTTIGAWIEAAERVFDGKLLTLGNYKRSLRQIAGDILSVPKSKKRFTPCRDGRSVYREQIDNAPLSRLTPEAIHAWRKAFITRNGNTPENEKRAKINANSLIRNARSLFSRKILKHIKGVEKPSPHPFHDVEMYPRESMGYISKIDAKALLSKAHNDLHENDPDAFIVLLLGVFVGLRRGEIDHLMWKQIDFKSNTIHIKANETGSVKCNSEGTINISQEFSDILRNKSVNPRGEYVIYSDKKAPKQKEWGKNYRCQKVFKKCLKWLRENDVDEPKPIHTLRKESGAIVTTKNGIYGAKKFLRHKDIAVTAMYYSDHKDRITVDLETNFHLKSETLQQPEQSDNN
jgi:integrase